MASDLSGVAGWIRARWRKTPASQRRLALLDQIALAPRQSLALIEAEGRRFLVATTTEGPAAFYPLNEKCGPDAARSPQVLREGRRTARPGASW